MTNIKQSKEREVDNNTVIPFRLPKVIHRILPHEKQVYSPCILQAIRLGSGESDWMKPNTLLIRASRQRKS